MHTRRPGRLSAATAQRLLDGGDGPSPLPQLLAAAAAPATAAELRGESAARAAFRSSAHSGPLPDDLPRTTPVRITTSIMIAKAVAAIALSASTAGGIALATTSTPANQRTHATSESATTEDAPSPALVLTTPTPTGTALDDPDEAAAAAEFGRPGSAAAAARTTPTARAPHATGLCRASSNITTDGQPGNAADSPAFTGPGCTGADDPADDAEATTARPGGQPTVAPGNPEQQTGKPDKAGGAADDPADAEDETAGKPGKPTGGSGAARVDHAERGRSGEHRQDG